MAARRPRQNTSEERELFEACREGNLEKVKHLYNTHKKGARDHDNYERSPLHWAAREGHLPVVEYLTCNGSNVNATSSTGRTPLHYASRHGCYDVVVYLVKNGVDIQCKDRVGWTPLHDAAWHGRESIVAYLCQQEGVNINEKNNRGETPLHLAAEHGTTNVVKCLLTDGHCDPNCSNIWGQTPLAMTQDTTIIRLLLQHGATTTDLYKCSLILPDGSPRQAAPSTISVFMVGDKTAGKSTLTKALRTEKEGLSRLAAHVSKVGRVKGKTAGMECHQVHSKRLGSLTVYDLAGHREYHSSHDTVIRNVVTGPSSGIFLLVVDLTADRDELQRTILYWLSFIRNQVSHSTPESPPTSLAHLLVVGSHPDAVKSKSELQDKQRVVTGLCQSVESLHFVDFVPVDCRYSESSSLDQVRAHILQSHNTLQCTSAMTFPVHCFHVYLISKCGDRPGIQLGELLETIQHDVQSTDETYMEFLPQDLSSLREVCSDLNRRGIMLFLEKKEVQNSWIIIDRDMLLREINGTLFAPKDFVEHRDLTYTGVVPHSKLREVFRKLIDSKQLNPELLFNFMLHMEFCQEIKEEDIIKLVLQQHPQYEKERQFLFPALTSPTPPDDLWKPQPGIIYSTHSSGWVLQCRGHHDHLSPRFLQVLLLRLTFTHALPVEPHESDPAHPALQQACTLWRNGVKWTTTSCVDVLVEIDNHRVTLLLRCRKDKEMKLTRIRAKVIAEILEVKEEFCPSTETVELFIPNPQYPVCTEFAVSSTNLAHSLCCDEESVLIKSHTPVDITDLLYFEPYLYLKKKCMVDLYSMSCTLSPRFVECAASSVCVADFCIVFSHFCTVLNVPPHKVAVDGGSSDYHKAEKMFDVWRTTNEGTYQRLREEIDQYSVFCGRNIFEIANIVPTPPTSTELDIPTEQQQQQQQYPAATETRVNQSKLDTKPTLLELELLSNTEGLKIRVMEEVAADWDNLAIFLQLSQHVIEIIQRDHHNQAERACREMFQRWLKGANATWRVLLQALEDMERQTLASDLRKLL